MTATLPYARMLEQMTDSIVYADCEGIIRFWNRASEAMFGFSADEALGQSLDIKGGEFAPFSEVKVMSDGATFHSAQKRRGKFQAASLPYAAEARQI